LALISLENLLPENVFGIAEPWQNTAPIGHKMTIDTAFQRDGLARGERD
jgi:hypothetical protein